MPDTSKNVFTDSFKVAIFLYKWRKTLLILGIAAALLSAIFSSPLFISPLFKSTVILYPASSNSISNLLLDENVTSKQDVLEYGEDAQTQQMLQILNSNKIMDKVIAKFKLAEHYGIDPDSKYYQNALLSRYKSNTSFRVTEYLAIKITVLDKDPQLAADIANEIPVILDSVKNTIQKQRALQGFKIVEAEYNLQKQQVQLMEDSLTYYMKKGVNDYETQAEMMNRQLAMEIARGNTKGINALDEKIKILAEYGGPYVSIRDALLYEKKQLSYLKTRYEEAKIDAFESLPQKFIIENAYKAEHKSYPLVWVIVLLSTLSALLAGMLMIFLVERTPVFLQKLKQTGI